MRLATWSSCGDGRPGGSTQPVLLGRDLYFFMVYILTGGFNPFEKY